MTLNDLKVRSLTAPEGKQRDYADDSVSGFTVRVGKRAKTFMLVTGSGTNRKRITIGRYDPPRFTLSMAREKARDILAEARLAPTVKKLSPTYSEALATFYATHGAKHRTSTHRAFDRLQTRHFTSLADRRMNEIETGEIVAILDALVATPSEALHAYAVARTLFSWAAKRRLIERSPMDGLDPPNIAVSRSRVLTPSELVAVWQACNSLPHWGKLIRCLILTGQRRGQFAQLTADMIDWERLTITWPANQMKAGKEHTIPIAPMLADILRGQPREGIVLPTLNGGTFSVSGSAKGKLDKICPVRNYCVHDLRRSWATISAEELDTPPHIIEAVLAHQSGTAVGRIYNRATHLPKMREAMERFEAWLALLLQKAHDSAA